MSDQNCQPPHHPKLIYNLVSIRDRLIEQLTREIQALKEELESFRLEVTSSHTSHASHASHTSHTQESREGSSEPHQLQFTNMASSLPPQSGRLCQALRGRVSELEAELAEQSHLRLQAAGESEFLKAELEDLRRVREDTEKEQRSLTEIESKGSLVAVNGFMNRQILEVVANMETLEKG